MNEFLSPSTLRNLVGPVNISKLFSKKDYNGYYSKKENINVYVKIKAKIDKEKYKNDQTYKKYIDDHIYINDKNYIKVNDMRRTIEVDNVLPNSIKYEFTAANRRIYIHNTIDPNIDNKYKGAISGPRKNYDCIVKFYYEDKSLIKMPARIKNMAGSMMRATARAFKTKGSSSSNGSFYRSSSSTTRGSKSATRKSNRL